MAPKFKYSTDQMQMAIDAVLKLGLSKSAAAKTFGVPVTTLCDKILGKTPIARKMGPASILSKEEEMEIIEWIKRGNRRGLPPHKYDVLNSVQWIIQTSPNRKTPFKEGKPGKTWWKSFMKKHPELSIRTPERESKERSRVTEQSIRKWFMTLKMNLEESDASDILEDPSRIYNSGELNIQLDPLTGEVIGLREWRNIYKIGAGSAKSTLTFVGTFNAKGDCVTPTLIYPYVQLPKPIVKDLPHEFYASTSESGWTTAVAFFDYITNAFHPWLQQNKIKMPVILFVDGHSTYLTLQVSEFCDKFGIILYLLPPNMSRILQPIEVGPFKPIKMLWQYEIDKFQQQNSKVVVRVKDVSNIIKNILDSLLRTSISDGFKITGLFPFNSDAVDFTQCLNISFEEEPEDDQSSSKNESLPKKQGQNKLLFQTAITAIKMVVDEDTYNSMDRGLPCNMTATELFSKLKDKLVTTVDTPHDSNEIPDDSHITLPNSEDMIVLDPDGPVLHEIFGL